MHKKINDSAKLHYPRILELSLIISIVTVTLGLRISPGDRQPLTLHRPDLPISLEDAVTIQPQPVRKPLPKPVMPVAGFEPELLDDPDLTETDPVLEPIPDPPLPPDPIVGHEEPEIPFLIIEERPELIGGTAFIYDNLRYPTIARKSGVEGDVLIVFVVNKTGEVSDIEIREEAGNFGFGEAARDVLAKTRWKPGKQRGHPVDCLFEMTIRFRIKN